MEPISKGKASQNFALVPKRCSRPLLASISFYLIFPNSLKNFSTSLSRVEEEMFPMKTRPEEGIAKEGKEGI
jgi:hypothetical protein